MTVNRIIWDMLLLRNLPITHQNWLVMMKPSGIQFSEPQRWLEPGSRWCRAMPSKNHATC